MFTTHTQKTTITTPPIQLGGREQNQESVKQMNNKTEKKPDIPFVIFAFLVVLIYDARERN